MKFQPRISTKYNLHQTQLKALYKNLEHHNRKKREAKAEEEENDDHKEQRYNKIKH